jgi:hypothetical protein
MLEILEKLFDTQISWSKNSKSKRQSAGERKWDLIEKY